ncbi:hypothetical protein PHLCEN_2v6151 [Hermanssonia centrifuga]|uniref:Uncharacterized protein n=1 Tax=Hermanssonia centrifuga TaxID=98765 RepID=A0A2R6P098_9APHY|nr:hypothetical protein PHLCEN_2v6151 [Hermanssonia centrifuga]
MVVNLRLVLATLGDSARGTAAIGASEYTCMEALATVLEAGPSAQEWDRLYALSLLGVLIAVVTAAKVHQAAETEPDTMACRRLQSQALGVLQTLVSVAAPTDLQYFCNQTILTPSGPSETAFYERCCLQLNCNECVTGEPLRQFFEFMLCITQFPEMRPGRMRVRHEHVSLSMCAVNACRRQLRMGDETHTWGVLNEGFRLIAWVLFSTRIFTL